MEAEKKYTLTFGGSSKTLSGEDFLAMYMLWELHSITTAEDREELAEELKKNLSPRDFFEFSGLTLTTWCIAIKRRPDTWKKYSSGATDVPDEVKNAMLTLAISAKAVIMGQVTLKDMSLAKKIKSLVYHDDPTPFPVIESSENDIQKLLEEAENEINKR